MGRLGVHKSFIVDVTLHFGSSNPFSQNCCDFSDWSIQWISASDSQHGRRDSPAMAAVQPGRAWHGFCVSLQHLCRSFCRSWVWGGWSMAPGSRSAGAWARRSSHRPSKKGARDAAGISEKKAGWTNGASQFRPEVAEFESGATTAHFKVFALGTGEWRVWAFTVWCDAECIHSEARAMGLDGWGSWCSPTSGGVFVEQHRDTYVGESPIYMGWVQSLFWR